MNSTKWIFVIIAAILVLIVLNALAAFIMHSIGWIILIGLCGWAAWRFLKPKTAA